MTDESIELAVPFTIWQVTLDPEVDAWATQQGLHRPEIRDRGRGQQAVYEVQQPVALAILDRIHRQADGLGDAVLRTRTRTWVRKTRGALTGEATSAPSRRRRGGGRSSAATSAAAADAVRHYLELVDTGSPPMRTSGRPEADVRAELGHVDERLEVTDDVLARLDLLAARRRLADELEPQPVGTPDELEAGFVRHAARFAATNGYTAEVFADFGVSADVLARAGLAPAGPAAAGEPS